MRTRSGELRNEIAILEITNNRLSEYYKEVRGFQAEFQQSLQAFYANSWKSGAALEAFMAFLDQFYVTYSEKAVRIEETLVKITKETEKVEAMLEEELRRERALEELSADYHID